ncbi:MAG: HesA/MoeB/ThiF family protein [Pseudomonadota bacterium]
MCAAPISDRQARHLSLADFGPGGVRRLAKGRALIIGVGGTGCSAAQALGASGIGELVLNDFDRIDASNLSRQILFSQSQLGELKVDAAAARLRDQNPALSVDTIPTRLDATSLRAAMQDADVVLDCSDNFATRFAINAACVATGTALVSGSAIRWEGQLAVFGPDYTEGACYRCIYSDDDESLDDCAGAGVLATLPGSIGQMMASEAIKTITGIGKPSSFVMYDARLGAWQTLNVNKRPDCPVCQPQRD